MSERYYYDRADIDYGPPLVSVTIRDREEKIEICRCWNVGHVEMIVAALNAAEQAGPVPGLSPGMLSEEDRRMLRLLVSDAKAYWEGDIPHIARKWQFAWADRLLADNHGEG